MHNFEKYCELHASKLILTPNNWPCVTLPSCLSSYLPTTPHTLQSAGLIQAFLHTGVGVEWTLNWMFYFWTYSGDLKIMLNVVFDEQNMAHPVYTYLFTPKKCLRCVYVRVCLWGGGNIHAWIFILQFFQKWQRLVPRLKFFWKMILRPKIFLKQ